MLIKYEDKEYKFNLEDITVRQLCTVSAHFGGMNLGELEVGLGAGDPNVLLAVYWLMLENNGEHQPLETLDFKVIKFFQAITSAIIAEQKTAAEAEEIAKTWGRTPKDESPEKTTSESG